MQLRNTIELIILAALWGASFLYMRVAVPEFGAFALIMLRTGIATLSLLPMLVWQKKWPVFKMHYKKMIVVGLVSTAIPFVLLSYATLYISAGFASILNATTTFYTAIIAWLWVNEKLSKAGAVGIVIGFIGVVVLMLDAQINTNSMSMVAAGCALVATFFYGVGINYSSQKLKGIDAITLAFGSQFFSAICLMPFAIISWPEVNPSQTAWLAVIALGVLSTGLAFVIFFGLIAKIGSNKTATVTYLIPFFGVLWGVIFLGEKISPNMLLGGLLIIVGVIFSTQIKQNKQTSTT